MLENLRDECTVMFENGLRSIVGQAARDNLKSRLTLRKQELQQQVNHYVG